MSDEIVNALIEANKELPDKQDVLERFKGDFAARLAEKLGRYDQEATAEVATPTDE
jgi:hypothetical protein